MKGFSNRRLILGIFLVALQVGAVQLGKKTDWGSVLASPAHRQKGDSKASVVLIEYSDFQCPNCQRAHETLKKIRNLYGDRVLFVYKYYPLEMHAWAKVAARYAECAGLQNMFWEYHDLLFDQQEKWSSSKKPEELFSQYARQLVLDLKKYSDCVSNSASVDRSIDRDVQEGDRWKVDSTPTFFINGKRFVGAAQLAQQGVVWVETHIKKQK